MIGSPALKGRAQSLPEWDAFSAYNYLDCNFGIGQGAKLLDKSPFHAHGDITTATWATGLHHRCLDFNSAAPDYVEIPASFTQLDFQAEDFSLIARIKVDNLADSRTLLARYNFNADGWRIYIESTGEIDFQTYQAGASQVSKSSAGSIVIDTRYTIGISRDGTSGKLYINGVEDTDTVGTHTDPVTCSHTALIGILNDYFSFSFDGKIEFLRVFGGIALPAEAHLWFHNMLK